MDQQRLVERYERVRSSVPARVKLIAVSKTRSVEEIHALYALGQRAFGENYPQELRAKAPLLPPDIEWHFIGHLQRSNVKHVAGLAQLIHGVDSERLMDELSKRARAQGRTQDILLQVHIAQEDTKHGFTPDELRALMEGSDMAAKWPGLRIRGLMGMATNTPDRARVSGEFAGLAHLFNDIVASRVFPDRSFTELSMGMTGDMDLAIAAGSTMVRVGTAIFGERG